MESDSYFENRCNIMLLSVLSQIQQFSNSYGDMADFAVIELSNLV